VNRIRRYGAAAAVALVAASLAACDGGDPEPKISPSSPVASPSSPAPTSGSATPEAETPEAFIRRWVDLQREAQNSGDTEELRSLSEKCDPCMAFLRRIDEIYAEGGFIETDGWSIRKIARPMATPDGVQVDVSVTSAPTRFRESTDADTQTLQGGELEERFLLERESSSWLVSGLLEVSQ
jgi:hypothetical protein